MKGRTIAFRRFLLALLAGVSALALAAPAAFSASIPGLPDSINIGSGTVGGGFYVQAGAIATVLEKALKIPVTAQPTGGSRENVRLLDSKEIQLALIAANNAYPAYRGEGGYGKKYTILAPLLYLYPNPGVFVALRGSGIRSVRDLKGKRVGWPSRTWDETVIKPMLAPAGVNIKKDVTVVYASMQDLYTQLGDGSVDAVVGNVSAGKYPLPAMSQLMVRRPLEFIPFGRSVVHKIVAETPYMSAFVLKRGVAGLTHNFLSVDIGGPCLYVRRDLSEQAAYTITKVVYENLKQLALRNKIFSYALDNPRVLVTKSGVPYHPGAVKFWKEVGLWR